MKNAYKLPLLLLAIAIYGSCGGDDTPPPILPTVEFTHERQFVEPGDEVAFVSTHTDADTFLWEFGDGATSTEQNPTHTYTTTGDYTVRVTVTSTTGDTETSTSDLVVGGRWIAGFAISSVNATDQDGNPWDENDGPDLFFGYAPSTSDNISLFNLGDNLTPDDFPVGGSLAAESQQLFTDEDWTFLFLDNDEPFDDINESQAMAAIEFNPVEQEPQDKDFTTGEAVFTITVQDFSFTVLYLIRN